MLWRFGERITAQLVSFVVSVLLARILMPEDYGIVAIVNIFIAIANIFVVSGLGTALIQKKDADEVDFSTMFWANLVLSILLYAVLFLCAPLIAAFYSMPILTPVLRVFGLKIPISSVNSIQNAYVSRRMDFKKFFFSTIIGTIVSAVVGIAMALYGFGVWALIAQTMTNSVVDTLVLFLTIGWRPKILFSRKAAAPLIRYGWKILATDLIGTIFNHLNAFIIGKKYTSADLAFYTQGKKMPELITNNISSTLCTVLFPAMSLSDGVEQIQQIRRKSLKMLEYVLFPMMLGMTVVADKMILVLLTEKWMFAVPYVRITCIETVIGILGTTLIQEVKAIGRSDITLKMELIKKPIFLVIALIAMQFGVMAIAYTMIINEVIAFTFNVMPVRKHIGFDFKQHILDLLPNLAITLVMCIPVYWLGTVIKNDVICLIVQILTGGILYLLLSVATKNESFLYLKLLISKRLG